MKLSPGFSLIELLIVLGIIVIVIAIAIPSMTAAKINANEASAVASLRAIQTAQTSYQTSYSNIGYAGSLEALSGGEGCNPSPTTACLIDETLGSGNKAGYVFAISATSSAGGIRTSYLAGAAPADYKRTGVRRFCTTDRNVIRYDANTQGSPSPPTLDECVHFTAMR